MRSRLFQFNAKKSAARGSPLAAIGCPGPVQSPDQALAITAVALCLMLSLQHPSID
jgi:hypothetical protein